VQNSSGLKRNVATQPSRTRYRVAGLLLLLAGVTYLDRACISILAPQISADLGLTKVQMSFVFSAFAMAYAAFEVPTAWWGERIGARRILTRIVVWWSCFTMFTAFAWNYVSMLVGLPLILSVAGDLSGGAITDFLTRRFGLRFGRCAVSVVGYGLAGTAMFASVFSTAVVSALLIAIAIASSMFALSASWATCMDVGGEHTALLSAAMNTTGQVGSILSPLVAGWIVTAFRIGRRHCSSWAAFIPFRPCCGSWWTHVSG